MGSISLLLLGLLVVVGGIIGLRWHPFLALTCAGLLVAALTPTELLYLSKLSGDDRQVLTPTETGLPSEVPAERTKSHEAALAHSQKWFVNRFTEAFGKGCGEIGLVIAMASIIGQCLLLSGGATRIVESLMRLCGVKGTPFAFAGSAFTLGIPVFFDTVFYLLMPLGKALRRETGKDYLLYILTIVAGATMAHSLVPPTPGPLTVAGYFGGQVSIGEMMLGGIALGLFTVAVGIAYAYWANRRWEIPLREVDEAGPNAVDLQVSSDYRPPLWLALAPIVLPVFLIGGETILEARKVEMAFFKVLGDRNIALIVAAAVSLVLLLVASRATGRKAREAVGSALSSAGIIILITAAGSSFGAMLKDTDIAALISDSIEGRQSILLIPIAFLVTALIRTAQGSATVAMITAGGMIGPIALATDLSYTPLYLALAIGCGSKPISWANDSGFWVIGRMSGMTPLETFKTVSVMMMVMAVAGLALLVVAAWALPLQAIQ